MVIEKEEQVLTTWFDTCRCLYFMCGVKLLLQQPGRQSAHTQARSNVDGPV